MSARLQRLLGTLIACEEQQELLSLDDLLAQLAEASGYRLVTIQAFFAKGLDGHILHGGSDGKYYVMGATGMSVGDLSALFGHRLADARGIGSREAWTAALRQLAEIGLMRGYCPDAGDAELVRDALEPD